MTTSRRADKRDDPVDGNDRHRGRPKRAPASDGTGNGNQTGEWPRGPRAPAQRPAPDRKKAASQQLGPYEGWVREVLQFLWRVAKDKQAQDGLKQLLKPIFLYVLWPIVCILVLLAVDAVVVEKMTGVPLMIKIGASSAAGVLIALGVWLRGKLKKRPSRRRRPEVRQ
jgi:hypothetical protein